MKKKLLLKIPAPNHKQGPSDAAIGTTIDGRFRILRQLGEGGAGKVYEAVQLSVDRRVAIKVLHPSHDARQDYKQRFSREAKAIARLNHANCITLHDFGYSDELSSLFMVMEFIEGRELHAILATERLSLRAALRFAVQIGDALAHAHDKGILHRDLKPENVLITASGDLKVLDFGLTRILDEIESEHGRRLTAQGMVYGTPVYMSPEQCEGDMTVDERSDLYALGVIIYEMIEGHPPFDSKEILKILIAHLNDPVPKMRTEIPEQLRDLVERMLEKDRDDRPDSAHDVTDVLHSVLVDKAMHDGHLGPDVSQEISRSLLKRDRDDTGEDVLRDSKPLAHTPPRTATLQHGPAAEKRPAPAARQTTLQLVGKTLGGQYDVVRVLGSGEMGSVFEATGPGGTRVALKVLSRSADQGLRAEERFGREVRALEAIKHPNVVQFLGFGHDESLDRDYIVMEHVDGVALDERLAWSPLDLAETLKMARGVALGLAAVHEAGVVHRDIKPANIMLVTDDPAQPRLLDFGLALVGDEARLTLAGEAVGSVAYMPPETLRGQAADERADMYGLGLVMFEALTGERAYPGEPPQKVAVELLSKPPRQLEPSADVPAAVTTLVNELIGLLGDRPSSAHDVAKRIEAIQATHTAAESEPAPRAPANRPPPRAAHTPRPKFSSPPRAESASSLDEPSEVVWEPNNNNRWIVPLVLVGAVLLVIAFAVADSGHDAPTSGVESAGTPHVEPVAIPTAPVVATPTPAPDVVELAEEPAPVAEVEEQPAPDPPSVAPPKPKPAVKPKAKPAEPPAEDPPPVDPPVVDPPKEDPSEKPLPTLDFNY